MHVRAWEREVVASIVTGDPEGLAQAYDRYADPLYKYCRSMLGDPADAADAVQDTFVIAASRLAGLREPERLCAWLYAVARNECLRFPPSARLSSCNCGRVSSRPRWRPCSACPATTRTRCCPGPVTSWKPVLACCS